MKNNFVVQCSKENQPTVYILGVSNHFLIEDEGCVYIETENGMIYRSDSPEECIFKYMDDSQIEELFKSEALDSNKLVIIDCRK